MVKPANKRVARHRSWCAPDPEGANVTDNPIPPREEARRAARRRDAAERRPGGFGEGSVDYDDDVARLHPSRPLPTAPVVKRQRSSKSRSIRADRHLHARVRVRCSSPPDVNLNAPSSSSKPLKRAWSGRPQPGPRRAARAAARAARSAVARARLSQQAQVDDQRRRGDRATSSARGRAAFAAFVAPERSGPRCQLMPQGRLGQRPGRR
jgi:hypothetical protein